MEENSKFLARRVGVHRPRELKLQPHIQERRRFEASKYISRCCSTTTTKKTRQNPQHFVITKVERNKRIIGPIIGIGIAIGDEAEYERN